MKIVTVKQKDIKDCGCCCLQSIIKHYHGYVPLEKIRIDCCTDSGGTSAFNLIKTAKKYGFESLGKRSSFTHLSLEKLPLIAHMILPNGFTHYVVVYKITKEKVTIMDPSKGKVILNIDDFKKIWTNIILIFHPKSKIINLPKPTSVFSIFLNYLKIYKNKYIAFIIINLCLMFLTLLGGFFLSFSINLINNLSNLNRVIVIFVGIAFGKVVLTYLKGKIESKLNYLIDISIFKDFISHIFQLPLYIMQNRTSGEIITRVNELNNIKNLFTQIFVSLFLDSILATMSLIVLLLTNKIMTYILMVIYTLYIIISVIESKIMYKKIRDILEKDSIYNNCLLENINMFSSVKNLSVEKLIINNINDKLENLCLSNLKLEEKFNFINGIKILLDEISKISIISVGIYLIFHSNINLSHLILYISILPFFEDSLKNIISIFPKYIYFKASFEKISEFYALENEKEKINSDFKIGLIKFKNVSLSFDNYHQILNKVNLEIKKNSCTLLTGDSGCGKSSLLKCLTIHDTYQGEITISNINIKDYSLTTLRKNIIYVGQNEKIFSDTLYNNIVFHRNVSINKFYKVCEICKIDTIIKNKSLRYMSYIDDDLSTLSGGERQRIILARALICDADVLLLDEALSEVDYELEINIINNIKKSFSNKTIVYVSHKDVKHCFENIICLNKGGVYE